MSNTWTNSVISNLLVSPIYNSRHWCCNITELGLSFSQQQPNLYLSTAGMRGKHFDIYIFLIIQITNRSFRYESPHLWNQLPSSFRQPHSVQSPPGLPHLALITSSQSPSSLLLSITPSAFHTIFETHLCLCSLEIFFISNSLCPRMEGLH